MTLCLKIQTMKSKRPILIVLAFLVAIRIIIVFFENKKSLPSLINNDQTSTSNETLGADATLSKTPEEAVTLLHNSDKNNLCESMRARYQNLKEIKKIERTSIKFANTHKKVGQEIYHLSFFHKDDPTEDTPTYSLYIETPDQTLKLIESSSHKKGVEYKKIEKTQGSVLYSEEGLNVGKDQDLFLHFENDDLKDLQGVNSDAENKDFIECRF